MAHAFPTIRRLLLILILLVILAGGLGGLYLFQNARLDANARRHRLAGIQAFARQDDPMALDQLGRSLQRNPDDVEALYQYASARQRVAMPNRRHLPRAASALRKVLRLAPDHPAATLDLLALYRRLGYQVETIELADAILANAPDHPQALRAKAVALTRLRRYDQAMPIIEQALQHDLLDYPMQLLALATLEQRDAPPQQLTDHANVMAKAHPDDPRTLLVQAVAAQRVGDFQAMLKLLRQAAEKDPPDTAYVVTLVRLLDRLNLYSLAVQALEQASRTIPDQLLTREIILRYFENEQYARAAGLVDQLRQQADDTYRDATLLAIQAISLMQIDRPAPAQAIVQTLTQREHDPLAQAWAKVLGGELASPQASTAEHLLAIQNAITLDADNAYLHLLLGDVYQRMHEPEMALRAWKRAAQLSQPWGLPRSRQVRPLLTLRREEDALAQAQAALRRQPENPGSAIAWTLARAATVHDNPDDAQRLLRAVNAIHRLVPDDELTLLLRLQLMLQTQQIDNARQTLAYALEHSPDLSANTLIQLAQLIDAADAPLADAALDRCQRDHELTAPLALAQAMRMIHRGQHVEAQRYFAFAQEAQPQDDADAPDWALAHCQLRDALNDPSAHDAWRDLLSRFPQNPDVARLALQAHAVQQDRALRDIAITQLRQATGDQAIGWRLHRAQWLLEDARNTPLATQEAPQLLREILELAPDRIEARVMLAHLLMQHGQPQLALRELTLAHHYRPDMTSLVLDIAALHEVLHDYDQAQDQYAVALAQSPDDPATLRQAAAFFAHRGQLGRAIGLLLQLDQAHQTHPNDLLLLAQCYAQIHAHDQLQPLASRLAQHPPDPPGLAWLAQYFRNQGDQAQEAIFTQWLDAQPLSPAHRLRLQAQALDDPAQARPLLEQALAQDPDDSASRQALLAVLLKLGDVAQALTFEELASDRPWLERFGTDPALWPMLAALVGDEPSRAAALALFTLLSDEKQTRDAHALASALRDLANRHRYVKPLAVWVIQQELAQGQPQQAAALASRTAELFPHDLAIAQQRIEALIASEQWAQVLTAAPALGQRDPGLARWADLKLAHAQTRLGLGLRATQTLTPYVRQAINDPRNHRDIIDAYVAALRVAGQDQQAKRFLRAVEAASPRREDTR